jgi:hypothetical protein
VTGPNVILSPFTRADLAIVEAWFRDPQTMRWLGGPEWPATMPDRAERIDRVRRRSGHRRRRLGRAMIAALMRRPELRFVELFEAGVEPENTASRRCLEGRVSPALTAARLRRNALLPSLERRARCGRHTVGVTAIRIPQQLADAVDEDDYPERLQWLAALPEVVHEIASCWKLELGEPYLPGGQCAWVAPARNHAGEQLVLKVGWRHREAEHEADALRFWDDGGAVRCAAMQSFDDTTALLLERCVPGAQLKRSLPEPEQDVVLADLMRRLWENRPPDGHPFGSLHDMCDQWADWFELDFNSDSRGLDPRRKRPLGAARAVARDRPKAVHRRPRLRRRATHAEQRRAARHRPRRPGAPDGGPARSRSRARQALAVRTLCARIAP